MSACVSDRRLHGSPRSERQRTVAEPPGLRAIGRILSATGRRRGSRVEIDAADRGRDAEESRLLESARGGDLRAFSRLVLRHQDAIYGLVVRLVGDADTAEELTQDVFLKAHRGLESFRGDARFSTWLYRIAVNLCHDHRASLAARKRKEETSLEDSEKIGVAIPDPSAGPDDVAAIAQMTRAFQDGLDALEDAYREAFLLRHQRDLAYDEIAEVLGISRSNAKVRVHRAREMILQALREKGHDV